MMSDAGAVVAITDTDRARVVVGDCLEVLASMSPDSIDACVTDPPYGLEFMHGNGVAWDAAVPDATYWRAVYRVLKPGAHLVAFSGTRTYHHLATAIEAAGFELRDMLCWLHGMGFPKAGDVGKRIDADAGAARAWSGFAAALKPAVEPIVLARKPCTDAVHRNVVQYGTGALNIDGCRVGVDGGTQRSGASPTGASGWRTGHDVLPIAAGRWPANVLHDGSNDVLGIFPATIAAVRSQRGESAGVATTFSAPDGIHGHDDHGGSAARFFYCAKASVSDRDHGLADMALHEAVGVYNLRHGAAAIAAGTATAPRRNLHPTVKPTALMRHLVRLVGHVGKLADDAIIIDPFAGTMSTGRACVLESMRFVGIEREVAYAAIGLARLHAAQRDGEASPGAAMTAPTTLPPRHSTPAHGAVMTPATLTQRRAALADQLPLFDVEA
ncbi:MAG: site-specific DNA-methyltransferase [Chloroflexi bacterium]|nr:site-specific DNA-methyltransferase [Chloroflexota bacterium]